MNDLVIRDGLIVDGTGRPGYHGDISIKDGRLSTVGGKAEGGRREINAAGRLVTPGFVDIHTHYDGQVTWDPLLAPSSLHGVTTAVMGNCGVGFAPVHPDKRDWIISLMEAVEDIPAATLRKGIPWSWESFPEYLDMLDTLPRSIDIGAQATHASIRTYVMGERGAANEPATSDELDRMAASVRQAMQAGALGFTSSRSTLQRTSDGKHTPGYGVPVEEIIALGRVLGDLRKGSIGLNVDFEDVDREIHWLRRLRRETGRPVWFLLAQFPDSPDKYKNVLAQVARASSEGEPLFAQVAGRPVGFLLGLESSKNPFVSRPSYKAIAHLPLAERVARLRGADFRRQLLSERTRHNSVIMRSITERFDLMFRLGDPPNYEPGPETSIAAQASLQGRPADEVALEILLERDGREMLFMPGANYAAGDFSDIQNMLAHPNTIMGLSDAGAHCGLVCDSSMPTFMLTHWARDRKRGPKLALEEVVRAQTSTTAAFYGLQDRGMLHPGLKADVNVIDFDRLRLHAPEMQYDLPADGRRLMQRVEGYAATIVSGEITLENDQATGTLPGKLIRGPRGATASVSASGQQLR
jgi:N-acyl-D-aspartate/D-glutamate deacylase